MPTPSEPRRHHYVPRFLLAGFTDLGSADGYLWVHDTCEYREPRRQRPDQVAHQRDYYRVDVEGTDPVLVEKEFGELEARTAPIVREIEKTWELPTGESLETLLNFVAVLAARVPSIRDRMSDFMDDIARMTLQLLTATPERYERQRSALRAAGEDVEDVDWETMRAMLKPGAMRFQTDRTWLVGQALTSAEAILRCLVGRKWGLMIAGRDMPNFVCCDNPVSLVSTVPLPALAGPGFGMPKTMVVSRLTRRIALLGMFEPVPPVVTLSHGRAIALVNMWAVQFASRWVFSPHEDFVWLKPDGALGHASDLSLVRAAAARHRAPEGEP